MPSPIKKITGCFLFIYAPDRQQSFFSLVENGEVTVQKKLLFKGAKRPDLLAHLSVFLKKNNILLSQLNGIGVLSGPGQFSFLRSGIIIANTCAWALHIPVVGINGGEFQTEHEFVKRGLILLRKRKWRDNLVIPEYGKEPNITTPKKKIAL